MALVALEEKLRTYTHILENPYASEEDKHHAQTEITFWETELQLSRTDYDPIITDEDVHKAIARARAILKEPNVSQKRKDHAREILESTDVKETLANMLTGSDLHSGSKIALYTNTLPKHH